MRRWRGSGFVAMAVVSVATAFGQSPPAPAEAARVGKTPLVEWIAQWRAASRDERSTMLGQLTFGGEQLPNPEAIRNLIELLEAPDVATRTAACGLLQYDHEDALRLVPLLVANAKDSDPDLRLAAASSLVAIAWRVEQTGPSFRVGMDELIAQARGDDPFRRRAALGILASFGNVEPQLVGLFESALKDESAELRRLAVFGLTTAAHEQESARVVIRRLLADPEAFVRVNSAATLAALDEGGDEVAAVLLAGCANPEVTVRQQALNSLESLGVARASDTVPLLIAALADSSSTIRGNAAGALGNLGSAGADASAAAAGLVDLTKDADEYARSAAAYALGHVGAGADVAVPALAVLLQDPRAEVRANAIESLKQAGEEIVLALPSLREALRAVDPPLRRASAELIALGGARSSAAVDDLVERLADPAAAVRTWSAYALRAIGSSAAVAAPALVQRLAADPEPKVRVEAARALAAFGPLAGAATDALVAACSDPDPDVRLWSLFALGEVKVRSAATLAALNAAARSEDASVRAEANKSLAKFGEAHDEGAIADAPGKAPPLPQLGAPFTYDGSALVLADANGTAVVVFAGEEQSSTAASQRNGVKYRFRYLARGQTEATLGSGEAFEVLRISASGAGTEDVPASRITVDAGPLRVGWSFRKAGSGYLYWRPEAITVTLAQDWEFETLDLRRYLR